MVASQSPGLVSRLERVGVPVMVRQASKIDGKRAQFGAIDRSDRCFPIRFTAAPECPEFETESRFAQQKRAD